MTMAREPYLVLRDFRVWFQKRKGFLEALRRAEPDYIRAVDGIDLDIGRGEIYCLVGESGCGKTTTGKGILKLVEPSGGDVFVGAPAATLADYESSKAAKDETKLEAVRRRYSLNYKEHLRWTPKDVAMLVLAGLAGAVLGAPVAGLSGLLGWLATGIAIGLVATLPPLKPFPRKPILLMPIAILGTFLAQLFGLAIGMSLAGRPFDFDRLLVAYESSWTAAGDSARPLLLVFEFAASAVATAAVAKFAMGFWRRRQGIEADKIRKLRKTLQIVFQDPYESLNPKHSVYDIVSEPLVVNHITRNRVETESRVEQALDDAGLRPPRDFLFRYPHELSGGQRQRVSIAGALVLDPDFLVADEPVSMLDVSIRTEIIELLLELRAKKDLTYLFITHDLSLAWVLADRIGVMYLGKIVEQGPTKELIRNPRHPYTKALVSVVPIPDPERRKARIILKGERPDPANIPPGCRFHPRCPVAFERCGWTADEVLTDLREITAGQPTQALFASARADGPLGFTVPGASEDTEAALRDLIATKAEEFRGLKAIESLEPSDGVLRVVLHPFEEPSLKEIAPGLQAACHLLD